LGYIDVSIQNIQGKNSYDAAVEFGCSEEIISLLQNTLGIIFYVSFYLHILQDLYRLLSPMRLHQYIPLFVKENIFKDVFHSIDESLLLSIGITKAGDRKRLLDIIKPKREGLYEAKMRNLTVSN
jgi:hypothetical protein